MRFDEHPYLPSLAKYIEPAKFFHERTTPQSQDPVVRSREGVIAVGCGRPDGENAAGKIGIAELGLLLEPRVCHDAISYFSNHPDLANRQPTFEFAKTRAGRVRTVQPDEITHRAATEAHAV